MIADLPLRLANAARGCGISRSSSTSPSFRKSPIISRSSIPVSPLPFLHHPVLTIEADKTDLATNADKYHQVRRSFDPSIFEADELEQDLAWCKAAFPTDYASRRANSITFTDGTLCGKWKVGPLLSFS